MAIPRPPIPVETKRALIREAGGKCANPGCANHRSQFHHIKEWVVYRSHREDDMIAVCPACHDAAHHGELRIDDETLYQWKRLERPVELRRDHIYVEPGNQAKLLLGSIAVTGDAGLVVFELGESNRLAFALQDEDILLLNLSIATRTGQEVLRVVDGHVRRQHVDLVQYTRRPGRIRVTAPVHSRFLPNWAIYRVQLAEAGYAMDGRLTLLDLQVEEPGLVRVQGIWAQGLRAVVITECAMHHVMPGHYDLPITLVGEGPGSLLRYTGPITSRLFEFQEG